MRLDPADITWKKEMHSHSYQMARIWETLKKEYETHLRMKFLQVEQTLLRYREERVPGQQVRTLCRIVHHAVELLDHETSYLPTENDFATQWLVLLNHMIGQDSVSLTHCEH